MYCLPGMILGRAKTITGKHPLMQSTQLIDHQGLNIVLFIYWNMATNSLLDIKKWLSSWVCYHAMDRLLDKITPAKPKRIRLR